MEALSLRRPLLLLVLLAGCSTPVTVQTLETARDHPLRKIALAPFSVGIPLAQARVGGIPEVAVAELVTARVLEALTLAGKLEVVPPAEVERVLGEGGPVAMPRTPAEIGARLEASFGVDAVLFGTVYRFVPRVGGQRGAPRPAAVWFDLELREPGGMLIWRGTYDEIQASVSQDLGAVRRAWERGFRWLSADELVQYGAGRLVRRLPGP